MCTENLIRVDDGMESPKLAGRATADRHGAARIDPAYERRKSALGRAAHSQRLLKLGFQVAQSSVAKYMVKRRGPPSQGWALS